MSRDGSGRRYSPVLGLMDADEAGVRAEAERTEELAEGEGGSGVELTVIVPARNEEASLEDCLESLVGQSEEIFALGVEWELVVVDDASSDGTRGIAEAVAAGRSGVRVVEAPELEQRPGQRGLTGKNQACWFGAQQAQGRWLLFTDADTVHEPRDLRRAIYEAERHGVALLSYSPRQVVRGLVQRALMPLVFSELAMVYPAAEVNDPARRTAAANGQFLLVERGAYFGVGGHRALGEEVLEDVELAYRVKRASGQAGARLRGLRFRYAPDALSTRMYRTTGEMLAGWRKNLARLFPHALTLAAWRMLDLGLLLLPALLWLLPYLVLWQRVALVLLWVRTVVRFYQRVARSNFAAVDCALAVLGLPVFVWLLVASWMDYRIFHRVQWKGREYRVGR